MYVQRSETEQNDDNKKDHLHFFFLFLTHTHTTFYDTVEKMGWYFLLPDTTMTLANVWVSVTNSERTMKKSSVEIYCFKRFPEKWKWKLPLGILLYVLFIFATPYIFYCQGSSAYPFFGIFYLLLIGVPFSSHSHSLTRFLSLSLYFRFCLPFAHNILTRKYLLSSMFKANIDDSFFLLKIDGPNQNISGNYPGDKLRTRILYLKKFKRQKYNFSVFLMVCASLNLDMYTIWSIIYASNEWKENVWIASFFFLTNSSELRYHIKVVYV